MPYQKQEQQTSRLLHILKRLYAFETLQASLVAQEYGVSSRTLLRDMNKISTVIPLHRKQGKWSLDTHALDMHANHLNHTLLSSFAQNIHIELSCLEKSNLSSSGVAFAIDYNKLPKILGEKIVDALKKETRCSFLYVKPTDSSQRVVDPIKLYTQDESWYLIARDYKDNGIKTFLLSRIEHFSSLDKLTTLTNAMLKEADKIINSVWHSSSSNETTVKLYIKPSIANYIEEKKLHKTQTIADRHYDLGLEVHCTITHKLEILPSIKSWLPHIHILEPKWLRDELMLDLAYYKTEDSKMDI